jgi:putative transposase
MLIPCSVASKIPAKIFYGRIPRELREIFHDLAWQKESRILEGHLQPEQIHVLMSIPLKYSGALVVGFVKGKSATHNARVYLGQKRNYNGMHFWTRGYHLSMERADERLSNLLPKSGGGLQEA